MHVLLAALVWGISFGAAFGVGRSWVEAKHAGGWPRAGAWLLAALSAVGFTIAYLLVALVALETFSGDPSLTAGLAPLWDGWYFWVAAPLAGFTGTSFLTSWGQRYRDAVTARASFPSYVALNQRFGGITTTRQAAGTVTADLTRRTRNALVRDRRRTEPPIRDDAPIHVDMSADDGSGFRLPEVNLPKIDLPKLDVGKSLEKMDLGDSDDSGKLMLLVACLVALIIALCLGVITTWIVIARIAGRAEPLPQVSPATG